MANDHGPKPMPSLLAGPGSNASPAPGILSGLEGRPVPSRPGTASRRGGGRSMLLLAVLACAGLFIALLVRGVGTSGDASPALSVPLPDTAVPERIRQAATVFDEPPPLLVPRAPPKPVVAQTDGVDPLQALVSGGGPRDGIEPAPSRNRRSAPPPETQADTDVALLAALMAHAGPRPASDGLPSRDGSGVAARGGPGDAGTDPAHQRITRRLAGCPAANTPEGLTCRQQACSEGWGEHPTCPDPARRSRVAQ